MVRRRCSCSVLRLCPRRWMAFSRGSGAPSVQGGRGAGANRSPQVCQQGRARLPLDECTFGLAHLPRLELLEPLCLAGNQRCYRYSIAVEDAIVGHGGGPWTRHDAARQGQWVGGGGGETSRGRRRGG